MLARALREITQLNMDLGLIKITSVNCRSVRRSAKFIQDLCATNDVILLQETWLLPTDLHFLNTIHYGFDSIGTSAVDISSGILVGRPYGGVAILYKNTLKCKIIECDNPHLCAIEIHTNATNTILLINVYMPTASTDNFLEYCELLGKIHSIVEDSEIADCLVIGDFNADPKNRFGTELEQFCTQYKYKYADKLRLPNATYTYVSDAHNTTSWLDHCLATENAYRAIKDIVIDLTTDWTDHRPLTIELQTKELTICSNITISAKPTWTWKPCSPNINEYTLSVTEEINQLISGNFEINDTFLIDHLYNSLVRIMQRCATDCLKSPKKKPKMRNNIIPGWNKYVADKYAASRRSLALWHQTGCPTSGPVAVGRKQCRAEFKRALNYCQRNHDQIVMDNIALNMKHKNFAKFWQSINKIIKSSTQYPSHIDGITDDKKVANNFNNIFCQPAPAKQHVFNMNKARDESCITISVQDIADVVRQTAGGKSPGLDGLTIEHIRYGGLGLYYVLSILFSAILKLGYVPKALTDTVVIPICKNRRKNISSSSNYRPIALANIIARLLEKILHKQAAPFITSSDCQHGFKSLVSTSTAIYVLKQVVGYYRSRNTSVIACYLDLSKAFDRVDHDLLWKMLTERAVPSQVVRVLKQWYQQQENRVRWKNELSAPSGLKCGVRQGGSMSPALFNVYMDGLSVRLNQTGIGCSINGTLINHICYADDMVLLAPSISAMRKLLAKCEMYAKDHNMTYNPDKSVYMVFERPNSWSDLPPLQLYGTALLMVDSVTYLGHKITADLSDHADIDRQRRAISVRGNMLARRFSHCSDAVKSQLFISYCTSVYTVELWANYTKVALNDMRVQYNDAWRAMFRLPRWCSASAMFSEGRAPGWPALLRSRSAAARSAIYRSVNSLVAAVRVWDNSPLHQRWQSYHTPIT